MRVLAIETATVACAVGVRDTATGAETVRVLDRERRHTEALTAGMRVILGDSGLGVRDLDRVVVDRGPGLFTGLRVGIAAAQALADALGIALAGVTSLAALAHGARTVGVDGDVLALVDARRGEVFAQRFTVRGAVDEPRVMRPDDVARELLTSPATVAGDGALRYVDLLGPVARDVLALDLPPIGALLDLGVAAKPGPVAPLYLRAPDAVAHFATRDRT